MTAVLRTPDHHFANLPDFPWTPNYQMVADKTHGQLRMHYLDVGPRDGRIVLMLHGEPSWCFLYRHMIHALSARGMRCIAPDLIGFGRSDKPTARSDYSYAGHVAQVGELLRALDINRAVLVCQDWGGPIGLSLLAEMPERFSAVVAANTLRRPMGSTPGQGTLWSNGLPPRGTRRTWTLPALSARSPAPH